MRRKPLLSLRPRWKSEIHKAHRTDKGRKIEGNSNSESSERNNYSPDGTSTLRKKPPIKREMNKAIRMENDNCTSGLVEFVRFRLREEYRTGPEIRVRSLHDTTS